MNKVNVLMVCHRLGLGGIEKTVINLAKNFNTNYFNVHVASLLEGGVREKELVNNLIPYMVVGGDYALLNKYIVENKIDAVHFHEPGPYSKNLFSSLDNTRVNSVIQSNVFSFYSEFDKLYDKQLFISKTNLYKYNKIFGVSHNYQLRAVMYNPVDLHYIESFRLSTSELLKVKRSLGISENDFVLGKVARKTLDKWSDLNLDILPKLVKKFPNIKFLVIGLPDSRIAMAKKMKVDKYIINLKETDNTRLLSEYYQCMDVLVHFSKIGECCSMAIQEGMAYGLPIITNSTPFSKRHYAYVDNGQVEQVVHRYNGYISNSINGIIESISTLISSPELRKKMSDNSMALVKQQYDISKITKGLEKETLIPLAKKGNQDVSHLLEKEYSNIQLQPTNQEILSYYKEYPTLSKLDFVEPSLHDRIYMSYYWNIKQPYRYYLDSFRRKKGQT